MELSETLSENGAAYAAELKRLLGAIAKPSATSPVASPRSGHSTGRPHAVLEAVVERALTYLDICKFTHLDGGRQAHLLF